MRNRYEQSDVKVRIGRPLGYAIRKDKWGLTDIWLPPAGVNTLTSKFQMDAPDLFIRVVSCESHVHIQSLNAFWPVEQLMEGNPKLSIAVSILEAHWAEGIPVSFALNRNIGRVASWQDSAGLIIALDERQKPSLARLVKRVGGPHSRHTGT
jgi:hypothetical protein